MAEKKKSPIEHHTEDKTHPWWLRGLNTGRVLGKHATRAEAVDQLRAVKKNMRS